MIATRRCVDKHKITTTMKDNNNEERLNKMDIREINGYLTNDEIADIRRERKAHKAAAIGTRSYYYKDDSGDYIFVSYWTKIARYNPQTKSLELVCHQLYAYSRTTVKHLNKFLVAVGYPKSIGINDIRKIAASGWHGMTIKSTLDKQ